MNEVTTTVVMVSIFCLIGVLLPMFLMIRNETKNPQSTLPNKLILWITMVFCMTLVLGIVVDFQGLSESIRGDIIKYGFVALMLFGAIFGIDQLMRSKYIKTVKWKDLTVEAEHGSFYSSEAEHGDCKPVEAENGDEGEQKHNVDT